MYSHLSRKEKKLARAVNSDDLPRVNALLSSGCSANIIEKRYYQCALLHSVRSAGVAEALLLHGADVNARTSFGESPLHRAISVGGGYEVVKLLLRHGATVGMRNYQGNTALTFAVKKPTFCPKLVKELVKYGASVGTTHGVLECPPLDYTVLHMDRYSLLVKYSILYNFKKEEREINLTRYESKDNYNELVQFYDECVGEVAKMDEYDTLAGNLSLYEFVTTDDDQVVALYPENKLATEDFSVSFPIYHSDITEKVAVGLTRGKLLNKLRETDIFTVCTLNQGTAKKIFVNSDAVIAIAQYLTNDDISNLIKAFEVSGEICSELQNFTPNEKNQNVNNKNCVRESERSSNCTKLGKKRTKQGNKFAKQGKKLSKLVKK